MGVEHSNPLQILFHSPISKNIKNIKIEIYPIDKHANSAYKRGHFVEAIQVLHGYLEMRMYEALMLLAPNTFSTKIKKIIDSCNEIPFREIVKILWILNYINDNERNELNALNKVRNEVVHDLFSDEKEISKKKYDQIFKNSINLAKKMDNKNIDLLG